MRINHPKPSSGAFEETRETEPALCGVARRTAWELVIGVSRWGCKLFPVLLSDAGSKARQCEGQSELPGQAAVSCPAFPVARPSCQSHRAGWSCFLANLGAEARVDFISKCFFLKAVATTLVPWTEKH